MRHARIARAAVMAIFMALLVAPLPAMAEEDPILIATPTIPTTPEPVVPNPAPVVVVRSYTASAPRLLVGSSFDLTIDVYNATARKADNVVVSLGAASSGTAGGAAAPAGGLTVLGTGNAKYVGQIKGQRAATVTFHVMAGPGTTPGAMTVPVTVSFEHEGVRKDVTYTIGLLLERDVALSLVTAELPETVMQGETFNASFEIGNASGFALSGVVLSVEASGAVVTDGSFFLGTMDGATTEALDVTITPEKSGPLEVAVVVAYRDDFGRPQAFRETRTVQVEVVPEPTVDEGEADAPETESDDNWFIAFIKALFGLGS